MVTWRGERHAQVRYLDIVDSRRRLAQAFDLMKRASSQRGGRSRQTQLALLRMGRPWPAKNGVRAPMASAGLGDLPATSPIIIRWSAKSGGAGEPSGALWRSRGRPPRPMDGPDARATSRTRYRGWEGVNNRFLVTQKKSMLYIDSFRRLRRYRMGQPRFSAHSRAGP